MKLNTRSFALACGIIWAGTLLVLGIANAIWPPYGLAVLQLADSIYPGYHAAAGIGSLIVGTLYALVDGCIGGWIFAWLYNLMGRSQQDLAP